MAASLSDIRTAIIATLDSGHGRVHGYERYTKKMSDLKTLYKDADRVKGWHVRRVATTESSSATCRHVRVYRWELRGFMSLDDADATELLFDDEIEAICDQFRVNDTLNGTVDTCIVGNEAGIQVQDSGPVMFAGVLCHSVRLALNTRVYL